MSYQVLARKYRPRRFEELVGQEHVQKALKNALDNDRLHHAYLFTGTRGVGKTTIARILSRCLNCEAGVGSNPCGECATCREIDEGRFVDLIEVDAASRTRVEDTRELLDNVQYAPTRGRYKVYLIDEVHMLSAHSFNALLKTLEEPPPHVKFLLATTDPQKLPVTVLSRCLQFNLKAMTAERIVAHLKDILAREGIPFDDGALWELARGAQGSMRDALSLTDQAIAHGNGGLVEDEVRAMLGTVDRQYVWKIAEALAGNEPAAVLAAVQAVAEHSPDWADLLGGLISLLHRVTVAQVVPEAIDEARGDRAVVLSLAGRISAADLQLFYQTALLGRRDLPFAPDPRAALEMTLLRMLAFRPAPAPAPVPAPAPAASAGNAGSTGADTPPKKPDARPAAAPVALSPPPPPRLSLDAPANDSKPAVAESGLPPLPGGNLAVLSREWTACVAQVEQQPDLPADVRALARNSALEAREGERWELVVAPGSDILLKEETVRALTRAVTVVAGQPVMLSFVARRMLGESPAQAAQRRVKERQAQAEEDLRADPNIRDLVELFGARIVAGSIKPLEEN